MGLNTGNYKTVLSNIIYLLPLSDRIEIDNKKKISKKEIEISQFLDLTVLETLRRRVVRNVVLSELVWVESWQRKLLLYYRTSGCHFPANENINCWDILLVR